MDSVAVTSPIPCCEVLQDILYNHSQIDFLPLGTDGIDQQAYLCSPPPMGHVEVQHQQWLLHYNPALPKENVESARSTARRRLFAPLIR